MTGWPAPAPAHASAEPQIVDLQAPGAQNFFTPTRIVDTRVGLGLPGPIPAHAVVPVPVEPSAGQTGDVDVHVTVLDPAAGGYLTVFGVQASTPPAVTDVNFTRGVTVSNTVMAPVPQNGVNVLAFYNASSAPLAVVVDDVGFTDPGSQYVAGTFREINPTRMLDTRSGLGSHVGRVPAGGTLTFQANGIPALEDQPVPAVSAVALNLSAIRPESGGYLTAFPAGSRRPPTSNLNFPAGRTIDNSVIVPLGPTGLVSIYNGSRGSVDLTADVAGYYRSIVGVPTQAGTYQSVPSARVVDSRYNLGTAPIAAHSTARIVLAGRAGISASRAAAVAMDLTAVGAKSGGYLTAWTAGTPRPPTANLNFSAGTTTNLALVPLSADGAIDVYNGSAHPVPLIIDVSGYFLNSLPRPVNTSTWSTLPLTPPPHAAARWSPVSCISSGLCATITGSVVDTFTPDHPLQQYTLETATTAGYNGLISCGTPTFCAAATTAGNSFIFDGHHWTGPLRTPLPYPPYLLSCTAQATCLAVSEGGAATLTGTTWTSAPTPDFPSDSDPGLNSVYLSCVTSTFCMAVSSDGLASQFNGHTWSRSTLIDAGGPYGAGPTAVSCPTTTFCMVTDAGGNAITYQDSKWQTPFNVSDGGGYSSVSCTSPTFCAAIGGPSEITFSGGTTWTTNKQIDGNFLDRSPISCISLNLCVVVDGTEAQIGHLASTP